jgi:8-oxo-dGTP diphosphatase
MRTDYCLTFAFSDDNKEVALIKKNRPHWQSGKFNGIGGKVEFGEIPLEAMAREFYEETGVSEFGFQKFATIDFSNAIIHCYKININLKLLNSITDEEVYIFPVNDLPKNLVDDVAWMIPMCIHTHYLHDIKISNP